MHGLNQSDYAARSYHPTNIRFTIMDPIAEKYYSISPYAYVANNPMKFIDPTGMEIRTFYKKQGENKMGQLHSINQSALYVFANSPQGKEFLSNYVQESQKIANVDIKGSAKAGVNLYIISGPGKVVLKNGKASYVDVWTYTNFNDEGGFDVVIELSYNTDSKGKAIIDIAHEAFIHGVGNFKLANDVNKKEGSKEQKQKKYDYQVTSGNDDHKAYSKNEGEGSTTFNDFTNWLKGISGSWGVQVDKLWQQHFENNKSNVNEGR